LISVGFAVFGLGGKIEDFSAVGAAMALMGLTFDGVYVPIVDRLKSRTGGAFVLMLYAQCWSFVMFTVFRFRELSEGVQWIARHPDFGVNLCMFAAAGSVGQVALFAAIALTDGLVVSIATTLRKFVTILISAVVYRHNLKTTQWIGVVIVFSALALDMLWKGRKNVHKD